MTSTAMQKAEPAPLLRPVVKSADLISAHEEATTLIREALKDDVDYGRIPGTDKPTLLKPGAERLTVAFGLHTRMEVLSTEVDHDRVVNWSKRNGKRGTSAGLYRYVVKCQLLNRDGDLVGEGFGSCSTMESKYVESPRDAENTVLKMAKKRAHVDAVLSTLGLSNRFAQDVEDEARDDGQGEPAPASRPPPEQGALVQAVSAEFERLRIPEADRKENVWRILGGRKAAHVDDLRDVLAVLKDLPTPPLEGEVIDDKKEVAA